MDQSEKDAQGAAEPIIDRISERLGISVEAMMSYNNSLVLDSDNIDIENIKSELSSIFASLNLERKLLLLEMSRGLKILQDGS